MAHIRYADLRNWSLKEVYAEGVRDLLVALGIEPLQVAGLLDLAVFLRCYSELIRLKAFADSMAQICFQLERLWFYLFKGDVGDLRLWFNESARKERNLNGSEVETMWRGVCALFDGFDGEPGVQ